ncbi:uncharacterized protein LOC133628893 [Colius striatus]|uniref:uncharacterized protein LOC133628893 n=1 Tax=Colius striatus TaxID=57412 RepID=UPI002B1D2E58|nr:uncharacterized protein LOC133628893 [Colius striatus]
MEPGPSRHLPRNETLIFNQLDQLERQILALWAEKQELEWELERQDQQQLQRSYQGAADGVGPSSAPPYVSVPHGAPGPFPFPNSGESMYGPAVPLPEAQEPAPGAPMEPGPSGYLPGIRPGLFTVLHQLRAMTNLLWNRNQELRQELERRNQQPFQHGYRGAGPSSGPAYVSVPHRTPGPFPFPSSAESVNRPAVPLQEAQEPVPGAPMEPGPSRRWPCVRPCFYTYLEQLRAMTRLLWNRNRELRRELERRNQQPFQHGYRGARPSSAPPYVSVPHRAPGPFSFPSSAENAGSSVAASGLWVRQLPTSTPCPVASPLDWGLTLTDQSWNSRTLSREPSFSRRESWQPRWQRLLGEIAFQLDRRIVHSVFPNADRYRGFSAATIPEGIVEMVEETERGASRDLSVAAIWNYEFVMRRLWALGYVPEVHLPAIEAFINTYGRLERSYWFPAEPNVAFLRHVVSQEVPPDLRPNAMVLLECLLQLAQEYGQPLFY